MILAIYFLWCVASGALFAGRGTVALIALVAFNAALGVVVAYLTAPEEEA